MTSNVCSLGDPICLRTRAEPSSPASAYSPRSVPSCRPSGRRRWRVRAVFAPFSYSTFRRCRAASVAKSSITTRSRSFPRSTKMAGNRSRTWPAPSTSACVRPNSRWTMAAAGHGVRNCGLPARASLNPTRHRFSSHQRVRLTHFRLSRMVNRLIFDISGRASRHSCRR